MGMIRLLLAIAVFNSHFPSLPDLPMVDGHEAVLAFFAISGFYMLKNKMRTIKCPPLAPEMAVIHDTSPLKS